MTAESGIYYADTSAVVRAYLSSEPEHEQLRRLLLEGTLPVVTSELTRVEFASAMAAAARSGRIRRPKVLLDRFDADSQGDGPLTLLTFDTIAVLPLARRLVREHPVRTLDALHLAVALTDGRELAAGEPLSMVTRDRAQSMTAESLGLSLV